VGVSVGVSVGVFVGVLLGVSVGVFVGVGVSVGVFVGVAVNVGVLVDVAVNVGVRVAVAVKVGVFVGVNVGVLVGVAVNVGVFVGVKVGVFVGTTTSGLRTSVPLTPGAGLFDATAVRLFVAPGAPRRRVFTSSEMPNVFGTMREATSTASAIPAGGVQLPADVYVWAVTSIPLLTDVVTLGAVWLKLTFVVPKALSDAL
jgi:hypothetical protein